ncbi:helix-turn-helix transcriptional regulator [Eubacteriaceae bacterium ES3]|nr:helix-turn-helix transcriptional regulator [Eubacteriaceae bacterium ES3]
MRIDNRKLEIAMATKCIDPLALAKKAGIAYSTIQRTAKRDGARPSTIGKIAKALDMPVEDLIEKEA